MTTFCGGCGQPLNDAHAACDRRLALDPPRFCAACGFRLDVQIYPDRVETACRECRRRARTTLLPRRGCNAAGARVP